MLRRLLMRSRGGSVKHSDVPLELLTGTGVNPKPRVRVDSAQTSFFEGREFRTFHEFSVANAATLVYRITSPVDFVLFGLSTSIDAGGIRVSSVSGGTAGGTWSTALPIIGKNRMSDVPVYAPQITVATGGTHTGGTDMDVVRLLSDLSGNSKTSVGGGIADERGLPAGTYYIRVLGTSGTATGVFSMWWEERVPASDQINQYP